MSATTRIRAGMDITNSTDVDTKYKVTGSGGAP